MTVAAQPLPLTFQNPTWRTVRGLLWVGATGLAVGLPALGGAIYLDGPATRTGGASTACVMTAALGLPVTGAMVLSALLTIPAARKADRIFDEFRGHHTLAEWAYTRVEWERYIRSEEGRLRKVGWGAAGLVGLPALGLGAVIAWASHETAQGRAKGLLIAVAVAVGLAAAVLVANRLYIAARRRRLGECPRGVIGRQAMFCGGDFAFWGSYMLELQSAARVEQNGLQVIEFIVGPGGAGRAITGAATVAMAFAGRASSPSNMTRRSVVLVPDGRTAEADAVLQAIVGSAPAGIVPSTTGAAHVSVVATVPPRRAPAVSPRATAAPLASTSPPRARSRWWWAATIALLVTGLALMMRGADRPGQLRTAMLITGFLMWCAAAITFLIAAVLTVRQAWHRRAA